MAARKRTTTRTRKKPAKRITTKQKIARRKNIAIARSHKRKGSKSHEMGKKKRKMGIKTYFSRNLQRYVTIPD